MGQVHLGSDPDQRSPVDFGFDEAMWIPRSTDEVLWGMQSDHPDGSATVRPYAPAPVTEFQLEQVYARKKGEKSTVVGPYDAEFRRLFDRKITEHAIDFMTRSNKAGKPFYMYLPFSQVHNPALPDPEYAGKTKHGNWADILTQMDDFTGRILDAVDELGLADDTIVVWASDNGPYPLPTACRKRIPRSSGGSGTASRGYGAAVCSPASRAPTGRRAWSAGRATCRPGGSAMSSSTALTGTPRCCSRSGRRSPTTGSLTAWTCAISCSATPRSRAVTPSCACRATGCRRSNGISGKCTCSTQDDFYSTFSGNNIPLVFNLEWDPREEHQVDFGHLWLIEKVAAPIAAGFLRSLVVEPPIKPGIPDPYTPPGPGEMVPESYLQIGAMVQYVTSLHHVAATHDGHNAAHLQHGLGAHSA